MSLKPFTYPFPETRFLHAGPSVYKFKIRYGHSVRAEEITDKEVIIQELESKRGHNLPGAMVPALQQSSSPPPQEPGTRSFFGFLSTLFPLRYFFKRSHQ
uniref:Membrane anchored junction protein n=1 Tax=Cavia porcellus TaxID=10141 RepID=A0A286XPB0_CAVPO